MGIKAFDDSNTAKNITEVSDSKGNLLWRVTREYGELLPVDQSIIMEKILLDAAESAKAKLG